MNQPNLKHRNSDHPKPDLSNSGRPGTTMPSMHEELKKYFGYDEFREGQEAVISRLLAGQSAAAVFPTGGGKSLCYQLPALCLDGLTIVVSPLLALMKDQIDALAERGIKASRLDSTQTLEEYRQVMDDIRSGSLRLLYVAPERFNNERFRASINNVKVSLFAIDEAHCISEWGHNFRPDYLKLLEYAREVKSERLLALTATATHDVLQDICKQFGISADNAINTGFYRSNLTLKAQAVDDDSRDRTLLKFIQSDPPGAAIVYVTLQKTAEQVADFLKSNGLDARHYHAGLKDEERATVQDWFIRSDNAIVVATIAFGMGIDKSNIRSVYHYNLPKSLENYSQEIGRAGRDGEPANCRILACSEDMIPLQNFVYGDTPTEIALRKFVESLFSHQGEFDISLYELSNACDIRSLVLRTLLTRLELDGYIKGGTPFYANYQFKPLVSSKEILARFEGERREFVAGLFKQATKGRVWFQIDLQSAASALGSPRQRLVTALDYLGEQGLFEVKAAGVRNRYTILRQAENTRDLAQELSKDAIQREAREIQRLQEVVDWICLDSCQTSALCARFDRALVSQCGHCGYCENESAVTMGKFPDTSVPDEVILRSRALQKEKPEILATDTDVAKVLCGLSSPAISKARMSQHDLFGRCSKIPFSTVLSQLGS